MSAKPKPLRRVVGAVLIPVDRVDDWRRPASAVPGLNAVELGVLAAIASITGTLRSAVMG